MWAMMQKLRVYWMDDICEPVTMRKENGAVKCFHDLKKCEQGKAAKAGFPAECR
jgi:hypothetical protein